MNLSDREIAELEELCSAVVDGSATDEQRARLAQRLTSSDDARRLYVRYLSLSAGLYDYADPLPSTGIVPSAGTALISSPVHRAKKRGRRWAAFGVAAAAAIVAGVWLPGLWRHDDASSTLELETDRIAAQITGVSDCRWGGREAGLEPGDTLRAGQHLELAKGIAEITFDCGAQITLEGPAALSIDSAWEATLNHGKMSVEVPHEAIGFRAASATVDVVDLGTEYCMLVSKEGETDVGVLQGSVQATPRGAPGRDEAPMILQQRRARRFSRTGSEEIENPAGMLDRFTKPAKLQRARKPVSIVRWPLDGDGSRVGRAEISGQPADRFNMVFESSADGAQIHETALDSGKGKFDGQLTAHAPAPGLGDRAPHTVAFWVRISPDAPLTSAGPIVAWLTAGANENGVQTAQITWNTDPTQGPLGALRTDIGRVSAVGTTNLRDGAWHFVAVVPMPRSRWQVRQYVDGRLDETATKVIKKRRQEALAAAQDDVIWLAGLPNSARSGGQRFQGELSELAIADRALAPPEIKRLMNQSWSPN
jgi:hypothetical protein